MVPKTQKIKNFAKNSDDKCCCFNIFRYFYKNKQKNRPYKLYNNVIIIPKSQLEIDLETAQYCIIKNNTCVVYFADKKSIEIELHKYGFVYNDGQEDKVCFFVGNSCPLK